MSKERLEEIKSDFLKYDENYGIDPEDAVWLIEQAEWAQELEDRNKFLEKAHRINFNIAEDMKEERTYYREAFDTKTEAHDKLNKDYVTLRKNSKRYREALEIIANEDSYDITAENIALDVLESNKNE